MKEKISREMEVSLEATEAYIKKAFGIVTNLEKMFNFSAVPELLGSVQWTKVLPVFIPQGVDNRQAVDSLVTAGYRKPHEEMDVMRFKGSEASDQPRLFLIQNSAMPDLDTMGKSLLTPVTASKLWLPLKGYAIAQGLYNQMTEEYLDSETYTRFPGETFSNDRVAIGDWQSCYYHVRFGWGNLGFGGGSGGLRLAIPVPLKV